MTSKQRAEKVTVAVIELFKAGYTLEEAFEKVAKDSNKISTCNVDAEFISKAVLFALAG